MPALASELRKTLETTVVDARDKAERGARDALTALAVAASEPFASMSEDERKLRNRLRARGRQLGDQRDPLKGTQSIERLVREMAYEHWHRMLFARFLAENQLLIEPSSGVAITLDECEELAAEEETDLWGMAAQFAQEMLPQIFRTDDPVLALRLPLEIRQQLQGLVAGLAIETFTASDSLGWTYQFWQTKRKKEVNDSGVKIGADELSPVTQLFTEDYMVDFLLDNTLGAWHAGKKLAENPELARTAQTEDELRQAVALPGCPWSYLRFIKSEENGDWSPAAGTFEGWPRTAAELKCLDPCMGSGHFVVAMFERLVALRITEENLEEKAAVSAVIEANLFGLEIDPRCTQIAAFNLGLTAWRRVGYCKLPAVSLACSGLAPNTKEADWLAIAGDSERLRNGMSRLYHLFSNASVLGSLINPRAAEGDLLVADFHELQPLLEQVLGQESQNDTVYEMAVTARGVTKAAEILAEKFSLVTTNVPYLGISKHPKEMLSFVEKNHEIAKHDLATVFIERMRQLLQPNGEIAAVTLGEWLYLGPYSDYRSHFLRNFSPQAIVRLGWNSFTTAIRANPALVITSRRPSQKSKFGFTDGSSSRSVSANRQTCLEGEIEILSTKIVRENPDSRFLSQAKGDSDESLLSVFAEARSGLHAGDLNQFFRFFWEVSELSNVWEAIQTAINKTTLFDGREQIIRWENEQGSLAALAESVKHLNHAAQNWRAGKPFWGKQGVVVGLMGNADCALYSGDRFDVNSSAIVPKNKTHLDAIWCYCESGEFSKNVRRLDNSLKLSPKTLLKVPFDLAYWQEVAAKKFPQGLPVPFSSDPTQWIFTGDPAKTDQPLQVATARLLGYRWPRQTGSSFANCPAIDPDDLESIADNDGIVCLLPIRGERAAADRLRSMLQATYGNEWSNSKERELLLETAVINGAKKAAQNLDNWLQQNFFAEHCKLFRSRPFVWQVWDGNPHGFSALVNYHKLSASNGEGRKTLELLTYSYLGDWIDRQKLDQAEGINGADDRLAAALDLQAQLKKILEGEPPYDIFVRWKALHQQPIGWNPDMNDGVRVNIRPFLNAQLRKGGKAGAGILRAKPGTIKWKKDRGKEPMRSKDDFPWFWGWDENNKSLAIDYGAPISEAPAAGDSFDGNRWNDLHYTRAAKEASRARHRGEG